MDLRVVMPYEKNPLLAGPSGDVPALGQGWGALEPRADPLQPIFPAFECCVRLHPSTVLLLHSQLTLRKVISRIPHLLGQ